MSMPCSAAIFRTRGLERVRRNSSAVRAPCVPSAGGAPAVACGEPETSVTDVPPTFGAGVVVGCPTEGACCVEGAAGAFVCVEGADGCGAAARCCGALDGCCAGVEGCGGAGADAAA